MKYLLCLFLDIHTPEKIVRKGEFVSVSKEFGRMLMEIPIRRCKFCDEIVCVG